MYEGYGFRMRERSKLVQYLKAPEKQKSIFRCYTKNIIYSILEASVSTAFLPVIPPIKKMAAKEQTAADKMGYFLAKEFRFFF